MFNPHIDLDDNVLRPDALVNLINAVWTLFHYYKNVSEKSERLMEQNYILEQNNKQLNVSAHIYQSTLHYSAEFTEKTLKIYHAMLAPLMG